MGQTLAHIAGRPIGPGHPPYVVAEMSGNHNGDLRRALDLITAAADAGADAVKIQTYTADTLTLDHDGPGFRLEGGLWPGRRTVSYTHLERPTHQCVELSSVAVITK